MNSFIIKFTDGIDYNFLEENSIDFKREPLCNNCVVATLNKKQLETVVENENCIVIPDNSVKI